MILVHVVAERNIKNVAERHNCNSFERHLGEILSAFLIENTVGKEQIKIE